MKARARVICDVCGRPCDGSNRIKIRGRKYTTQIYHDPDGDYFSEVRSRFDMCGDCLDQFRKFMEKERES